MTKRLLIVLMLAASVTAALADTSKTVTISGSQNAKQDVIALSFDGDNVTLAFGNGTTQTVDDMETLSIELSYNSTDNISVPAKNAAAKGGIYTLDGQYKGTTTAGLKKGVYIVDGRKTIVK